MLGLLTREPADSAIRLPVAAGTEAAGVGSGSTDARQPALRVVDDA
jgi:hypothetical protein